MCPSSVVLACPDPGDRTSLAYCPESVERVDTTCPTPRPGWLVDPSTGTYGRPRCKRAACHPCRRWQALGVGGAIALARPSQRLLVTQLGYDWPSARAGIRRLVAQLRRGDLVAELVYHLESGQGVGGLHAHACYLGSPLDRARLAECAQHAGLGSFVGLERCDERPLQVYGMKDVLFGDEATLERFLKINGGRLARVTRGFWRDGRTGRSIAGLEQAVLLARRRDGATPRIFVASLD